MSARCGLCGRGLIDHDAAEDKDDPRIDCGGDCLGCMVAIEEDWTTTSCECLCGQNHEKHGWRDHCRCECVRPATHHGRVCDRCPVEDLREVSR